MKQTNLDKYDNSWYNPGPLWKRILWYYTNLFILNNPFLTYLPLKLALLKIFGATIGKGVIIKPKVNIKFPWFLTIGDYTWIGEDVWIDNLEHVKIGNNCCLSQGCMILSGNHDYSKSTFDLRISEILLEDGVWIGAKAIVTPGVICRTHSILTVSSVGVKELMPYTIYQGNPAQAVKTRIIE